MVDTNAASSSTDPWPSTSVTRAPNGTQGEQPSTVSEPNTLFLKIERFRRLFPSRELEVEVSRGEDNTFGLGLSEDNMVKWFVHDTNSHVLQQGDQIRAVGGVPLVRQKLADVFAEHFPDYQKVRITIARESIKPERGIRNAEVFVSLQLLSKDGDELDEWLSDFWTVRPDHTWGAFWTLPIIAGTRKVRLVIHVRAALSRHRPPPGLPPPARTVACASRAQLARHPPIPMPALSGGRSLGCSRSRCLATSTSTSTHMTPRGSTRAGTRSARRTCARGRPTLRRRC